MNCMNCKQLMALPKRCSRCKTACYCSQECQKLDWKRHKPRCVPVTAPTPVPAMPVPVPGPALKRAFFVERIYHCGDKETGGAYHFNVRDGQADYKKYELTDPFLYDAKGKRVGACTTGVNEMYLYHNDNGPACVMTKQRMGGDVIFIATEDKDEIAAGFLTWDALKEYIKQFCLDKEFKPERVFNEAEPSPTP